jgi:integrase
MGRLRTGTVIWRDDVSYARVQWSDENGKRRQKEKKADNKTHARHLIKAMLRELEDYGSRSLDAESRTFVELADFYEKNYIQPAKYVEGRKVSGLRSLHTQKYTVPILREYFGKRKLRSITYGDLTRFRLERSNVPTIYNKPRSITTVNRELGVLRHMLNIAFCEGWILRNPFTSGPPLIQKAHEKKREKIVTLEEEQLIAACTDRRTHLKPIIICALDTGMRRGEILTLSWSDVDFDQRRARLHLNGPLARRTSGYAVAGRTQHEGRLSRN